MGVDSLAVIISRHLSSGSVYTEMNAVAKGVSLGIIDQSRKKEMEPMSGEQPYVDLMGKR